MTTSVVGLRSSKTLPQAQLAPKAGHGHCLVACCPSGPLQLSKSWWNHYIWEVCSANWWDAPKTAMLAASTGQQKEPISPPQQCLTARHTSKHFKNWMNRAIEFCFNWHFHRTSHQLTTSSSSILTTFCRENIATTIRLQKNAFQVFVESWNIDFDAIGIKKLIPCWKNVLIVMVLILINEDVFEPSYNDLKFTLQNYNYFCTKYFCTKSIP